VDGSTGARRVTRGGLIKAGAVVALAAGAGGAGASALPGATTMGAAASGIRRPNGSPDYLSYPSYARLVGADFRLHRSGARTLGVRLIEARESRSAVDSFSLLFRGNRRAAVDAGIYRLEHPSLGRFELFLSPVSRGVKGLDLEAVINRIAT
jgi:Domain of unknown function (DUF6916)